VIATFRYYDKQMPALLPNPPVWAGVIALAFLLYILIKVPLSNPGRPDEPAPPSAMM
jgi:hypothetical protein